MENLTPSEQHTYDRNAAQARYQHARVFLTSQGLQATLDQYVQRKGLESPYLTLPPTSLFIGAVDLPQSTVQEPAETKRSGFRYFPSVSFVLHRPVQDARIVHTRSGRGGRFAQNTSTAKIRYETENTWKRNTGRTISAADLQATARAEALRQAIACYAFDFTPEENTLIAEHKKAYLLDDAAAKKLVANISLVNDAAEEADRADDMEPEALYIANPLDGIKPTRLKALNPQQNKSYERKRRLGHVVRLVETVLGRIRHGPELDERYAVNEGLQDIVERYSPAHNRDPAPVEGRLTVYGIMPTAIGLKPRASAAPGQLERPDLYGKPQNILEQAEHGEESEDVVGALIPSQFALTLEAALHSTRWNTQLNHRSVSLEGTISDIGFDGSRIVVVHDKNGRHNNPLNSAQYQEDLIPRMERAAENLPRRR